MIAHCKMCGMYFDDQFRNTICPHEAFPANDGQNNFAVNAKSYLSRELPTSDYAKTHNVPEYPTA